MQTIHITLSPVLASEVQSQVVDAVLYDIRNNAPAAKDTRPELLSMCEKVEANHRQFSLTLPEAIEFYDELVSLEDRMADWVESGENNMAPVLRAVRNHMRKLRAFGVQVNDRGWARQ